MSVIGNEFSGLPMEDLIGGPLKAACDAQIRLAKASADFINTVGFNPVLDGNNNPTGKVEPKQVDFSFWEPLPISPKPEVLATATLVLEATGTPDSKVDTVKSITINGVEVLGTIVSYSAAATTDEALKMTAHKIAVEISNYKSTPEYEATANGAIITISAKQGSGTSPNGFKVTPSLTGSALNLRVLKDMGGGQDAAGATTEVQKVVLSVPFLSIVNVPSLMIRTVDITFDMEVKTAETHKDDSAQEASLDASARFGWGPFSGEVKIHGAISAHQENTRSTDRSAKYHVSVQAKDDGMPEGLCRVLDILQKAIAPVSIGKSVSLNEANIAQNQTAVV